MTRILVPLDGSSESESGLHYADLIASGFHAELVLLHCLEPPGEVYTSPIAAGSSCGLPSEVDPALRMMRYLRAKQQELEFAPCHFQVKSGEPAMLILESADLVDMVVMSRFGRRSFGGAFLGSVTNKVARECRKPVFIAPSPHVRPKLDKILVCLDPTRLAGRVLSLAAELAQRTGGKLMLFSFVRGVHTERGRAVALDEANACLANAAHTYGDLVIRTEVRPAGGPELIQRRAAELDADLIVVGSQRRRGLTRWALGSVAEEVLVDAHCPVLIIPPGASGPLRSYHEESLEPAQTLPVRPSGKLAPRGFRG